VANFEPPEDLVVLQTQDWVLNHRVDTVLPGYLMLGARMPTNDLSLMRTEALAELGALLAATQKALNEILKPRHLYIGRYGHMAGHSLHFHIMPICSWVKDRFFSDPRYRVLGSFCYNPAAADETDGAELTMYVWREFCENPVPPMISGPSISEVVDRLRERFCSKHFVRGAPFTGDGAP
jgi:diadenosine tetraphosphate (Ap4A) HIT family hydrolase